MTNLPEKFVVTPTVEDEQAAREEIEKLKKHTPPYATFPSHCVLARAIKKALPDATKVDVMGSGVIAVRKGMSTHEYDEVCYQVIEVSNDELDRHTFGKIIQQFDEGNEVGTLLRPFTLEKTSEHHYPINP